MWCGCGVGGGGMRRGVLARGSGQSPAMAAIPGLESNGSLAARLCGSLLHYSVFSGGGAMVAEEIWKL